MIVVQFAEFATVEEIERTVAYAGPRKRSVVDCGGDKRASRAL
jgi:hypothetical protein